MAESYSQLGQDVEVLKFYGFKKRGYYIEVGASDGVSISNTLLLDKKGWKGICVEPIPSKFAQLKQNRPNAICINAPLYSESGTEVVFDICHSSDFLSGISQHIDKHKQTVDNGKTQLKMTTMTLNEILKECKAPPFIEYLSLDTEGSEYEILKTFDFKKYQFGIIDVEHNYIEPRRSQIRELLTSNGYVYHAENQWDDQYIHEFNF